MKISNRSFPLLIFLLFFVFNTFGQETKKSPDQFLVILGVAQDAGYPQIGCERTDCLEAQVNREKRKMVVSLGLVDKTTQHKFLFEATPDIGEQLYLLNKFLPSKSMLPDGVFLTHGHIGHYTGLMYFGREAIGAKQIPIYAMPRMQTFLTTNAPWSQLVGLDNIALRKIEDEKTISLNENLKVTPFEVPHRDEFTETVGYKISGKNKSAIFIPDIDKWNKWEKDLREVVKENDYILIDATFYKNGEIPNRDMSEIPHPFVEESISLLKDISAKDKAKVIFIHFNHTNPLINNNSPEKREVLQKGFRVAEEGLVLNF